MPEVPYKKKLPRNPENGVPYKKNSPGIWNAEFPIKNFPGNRESEFKKLTQFSL